MWLFFAFLSPALYGVSQILDNFLTNRLFKNPWSLVLCASLLNIFFVPIIFFIETPVISSLKSLPIFIALGFIQFAYLYPYYRGLQSDDTSVNAALFGLGRIFVPILAFLIVGEVLTLNQYFGVFLIIFSSVFLSLQKNKTKFTFSKSFWYIGLASFMLSFEGVLVKLLFNQGINFSTVICGEMVMATFFSLPLFFFKKVRREVVVPWSSIKIFGLILLVEELLTFLAFSSEIYAINRAPVTLVKSVVMFIPFFVLFYGRLLKNRFPKFFNEKIGNSAMFKKVALFCIMIIGIYLIAS